MQGARTENYKMRNSCSQFDSKPVPSVYGAKALIVVLLELMSIEHLKFDSV